MKIKSGNISLDQLLKECDELIKRTVQIKNYKKSIIFEKIKPAFIEVGYLGTFGKNATKKFKDSLSFISQVPF